MAHSENSVAGRIPSGTAYRLRRRAGDNTTSRELARKDLKG